MTLRKNHRIPSMNQSSIKETSVLMFNKQQIQYQIFIKNPLPKSALQKAFLPCKIKMKSILKIINQPLRAAPQKYSFTQ